MWWQYVSDSVEGIFILDSSREQTREKREESEAFKKALGAIDDTLW